MCLLQTVDHVVQDVHAGIDGAGKVCFLGTDDLLDIGVMLAQLGVSGLAGLDDRLHQLHEEGAADAQHTAMAGSAAQQTAHNVAAALVGGQDAVGCHKDGGTDMVGDDADGDVVLFILFILLAGDALHMVQHGGNGVDLEQVVDILHNDGQTLQAHAGIDVGLGQQFIVALAVSIVLAEDQVPDLHEAVAITADATGGFAAAVLQAAVIVDLRAGAAGAGTVLPEVVLFSKAENTVCRNTDFLIPDLKSLVVIYIDGGVQAVRIQADYFC